MGRLIVLIAFAAINGTIVPALASECTSKQDVSASRTRWAMLRKQAADVADIEKTCRAYAASFYETVTLRQAAAKCVRSEQELVALDSEVNAFNDLLATKCGG